jgi:dienelactone hydrolase
MKTWMQIAFLFLFALSAYYADAAGEEFTVTDLTWHDAARNRDIPVRIYAPKTASAALPVVIFSHGLGGSREGGAYLGRYWASHGYVSVHVQHPGSDSAVATSIEAMQKAMRDPQNFINRPKDISFAIDQLTALNAAEGSWKNRFDLERIGVAGHSFGAYTTLAVAGEKQALIREKLSDSRVKAVVILSAPNLRMANYDEVHIPAFHITGTEDVIHIVGATDKAIDRRIPFDKSSGPDTYLAIFEGGNHGTFGGRDQLLPGKHQLDVSIQDLVCQGTTAFWDAYLKGDSTRKEWLANGPYSQLLGGRATFEKK